MDALQLLTQRRSIARLIHPAPAGTHLDNILAAGLRAPDHGGLTPWEFVVISGDGLDRLSQVFQSAAAAKQAEDSVIEKAKNAPYRAPMIITVIAKTRQHIKVPFLEQYISAGCAAHAMQMAAVAQGFQGFWRTGNWAYDPNVRQAFGVEGDDQIVGFLYLGTADCTAAEPPQRDLSRYVKYF